MQPTPRCHLMCTRMTSRKSFYLWRASFRIPQILWISSAIKIFSWKWIIDPLFRNRTSAMLGDTAFAVWVKENMCRSSDSKNSWQVAANGSGRRLEFLLWDSHFNKAADPCTFKCFARGLKGDEVVPGGRKCFHLSIRDPSVFEWTSGRCLILWVIRKAK